MPFKRASRSTRRRTSLIVASGPIVIVGANLAGGRAVEVSGGERVPYEKLLLVTGGRPRTLSSPGADLPGITTFRTYRDAEALSQVLKPDARVVVVGAGFIGSEIAASARVLGCEVT